MYEREKKLSRVSDASNSFEKSMWCEHDDVEQALRRLFVEAFEGAQGPTTNFVENAPNHGLLGVLNDLTAAQASTRPQAGRRTTAAHAAHLLFGLGVTLRWLDGERGEVDWSPSWRTDTVTEEEWRRIREDLRKRYDETLQLVGETRY